MTDIVPLEPFIRFELVEFNVDTPDHGDPIINQLDALNQRMIKFDWHIHRIDGNILALYVLDGADSQEWLDCLQALGSLTMATFYRFAASDTPRRKLVFRNMEHLATVEEVQTMGLTNTDIETRVFEFEFGSVLESEL